MVEDFLKEYAKLISDSPDIIRTERINLGENFDEIVIYASRADTGKLIGKDGKMINAIKTVVIGYKAKDPTSYRITVKAIEEWFSRGLHTWQNRRAKRGYKAS